MREARGKKNKKSTEREEVETFEITHALESNETFCTPKEVNISREPPPKKPALLRRTTPLASVTLPPLLFFFQGKVEFFIFLSRFADEKSERTQKNFGGKTPHAMTDSPPLFIPEKQSSTTKSLIGPRPPVEASTVQTEPKWKPPFFFLKLRKKE